MDNEKIQTLTQACDQSQDIDPAVGITFIICMTLIFIFG